MSNHIPAQMLKQQARIVATPVSRRNRGERVFDIHPAIHLGLGAAYLAFVGILATAFMGPDLIVPTAIFVIGVIALLATPALWARIVPTDGLRKPSFGEFLREGVDTITGRLTAGEALAQILVLPALMVALAGVMALIKALV